LASVVLRKGRWYVKYRNAAGRWVRRASTASTKTAAKRLAADVERAAERQRFGLEPQLPEDGGGTLGELLRWWLATYSVRQPSELPLVRWTGGLGRRSASGLRFVLHGRPVAERRMSPA